MKLSILHRTADFRGDHSADILIAHETVDGEAVTELARRILNGRNPYHGVIEIRLEKPSAGPMPTSPSPADRDAVRTA